MESIAVQFGLLFERVSSIFEYFGDAMVFWLPVVLGILFWNFWLRAVRRKWISNREWVMLEIKLPKDIRKTPFAMEVALGAFFQKLRGTWVEWYFQGRVRNWFSLELVSLGGDVKFFIRTPEFFKDVIEAQIYAQYPTVEIYEVPDYTKYVNYTSEPESEWDIWGTEYKLEKEDAYPIKTYIDFHLDKEGIKQEEMVDPMTATIEFLGSAKKGEQIWIQIMIQPTDKRFKKSGAWFKKEDWKGQGEALIEKIIKKARSRSGGDEKSPVLLSSIEKNQIDAIERNIAKLGFDCGIRAVYLAKKDKFNASNIVSLLGLFRQYASNELNEIKYTNATGFQYPWQDFRKIRENKKKRIMFDAYKRRSFFYVPYRRKPFVLNMEELATIFHFPGGVAETPTFGRIESKKGEPPVNLPGTE